MDLVDERIWFQEHHREQDDHRGMLDSLCSDNDYSEPGRGKPRMVFWPFELVMDYNPN